MTDSHRPNGWRAEEVGPQILLSARQRIGMSGAQLAALAQVGVDALYDLECHQGELDHNVDLGTLGRLCSVLHIDPRKLFSADLQILRPVLLPDLIEKIRECLRIRRVGIAEFEEKVGYDIAPCLEHPQVVLDWNVDCLRAVCAEIGVDWLAVLGSLPMTLGLKQGNYSGRK